MRTGAGKHRRHVVILIDRLHRHEAFARVGQRHRDRPRIEVEYRR
jgi:hypothetical protein